MKLTVAPAAVADLARLREVLVGKDPAAADRAIAALIAAIESPEHSPNAEGSQGR